MLQAHPGGSRGASLSQLATTRGPWVPTRGRRLIVCAGSAIRKASDSATVTTSGNSQPSSSISSAPSISRSASNDLRGKVAIVGAGISGLATALALQQKGIPAVVLEKGSELRTEGAAIGVWSNGLRALDRLGLGEQVRAAHPKLTRVELCSSTGNTLRSFHMDSECDGGPHDFRGVRRLELLHLLRDRLNPGSVIYNIAVESLDADTLDSPDPVLKLAGGGAITARAIVGCDGARSAIAEALGVRSASLCGYAAHRGIATFPAGMPLPLPVDTIRQTWGLGVRAGLYPVSETEVYWFTCFNDPLDGARSEALTPAELKAEALSKVSDWPLGIREAIEHTPDEEVTRNRIADRFDLPASVGRGGATLAGDALHPMTPNLGQGGCCALEDAVMLARAVRGVWNAGDHTRLHGALRAYERQRMQRALPLVARSHAMGRLLQTDNKLVCLARNTLARSELFKPVVAHFLDHTVTPGL